MLVVALCGLAFTGRAQSGLTVKEQGANRYSVHYKGDGDKRLRVSVYNESGARILVQTLTNLKGFILPLDFESARPGPYRVEVTTPSATESVTFVHGEKKPFLFVSELSDDRFLVSVPVQEASPLSLRIYDAEMNVVHTEEVSPNAGVAKVYNLSKVPSGEFYFEVSGAKGTSLTRSF